MSRPSQKHGMNPLRDVLRQSLGIDTHMDDDVDEAIVERSH